MYLYLLKKTSMNKWRLNIKNRIFINDQEILKDESYIIPPTNGNRTDIIGTSGKYYCDMSKEKFFEREKTTNENTDWTPRKICDEIYLTIEIKNGEVSIKG